MSKLWRIEVTRFVHLQQLRPSESAVEMRLRRLFSTKTIVLPATVDDDLLEVRLYEMGGSGTVMEGFESLGKPRELCLSTTRIEDIRRNHGHLLRIDGRPAFALSEKGGVLFLSELCVQVDGRVSVERYEAGFSIVRSDRSFPWIIVPVF